MLRYVELTQLGRKPALQPPRRSSPVTVMAIDPATRANLELTRTTSGERQGSLIAAIDRTVTGAGARELNARLASPLKNVTEILGRLDAVGYLAGDSLLRGQLREPLRRSPDIARALREEEGGVLKDLKAALGKDVTVKPDIQLHHEQFDVMAV